MNIGWLPSPLEWGRWPEVEALLRPAAERGNVPVYEDGDLVWLVMDGPEILAAATTWLSSDGYAEVTLVGGREHRRWLKQLDETIGAAALEAGASRLVAFGRRGWVKALARQGWEAIETERGERAYTRCLGVEGQ